jgi:hypothetical protein
LAVAYAAFPVAYAAFAVVDTIDIVLEIAVVKAVVCTVASGNVNVPSAPNVQFCDAPPVLALI